MRFMPFYPLVIHIVSSALFFIPLYWVGLLVSIFFYIASCVFLYKLLRLDYSKKQSIKAIVALLVFPTSFFFISVYSESLFLFLTVSSFYFSRRKKWNTAAFFGFLSSLTRIVGFLTVIPLLIEYFSNRKKNELKSGIILLITPLGIIFYSIYNFIKWHNPLLFIHAQSQLSNGRSSSSFIFFPQTLYRYCKIILTVSPQLWEWKIAVLELISFCAVGIGIYLLWKQKVRLSYIVYTFIGLLVPASTGTYTGLPRYIIVLFPLLILFSKIRNKVILFCLLVIFFILQIVLFLFFSRGYYVA